MQNFRLYSGLIIILSISLAHARTQESAYGIRERVNRFVHSDNAYRSLLQYQYTVGFSGITAKQPWSSSYWPLSRGMSSFSYAIYGSNRESLEENYNFFAGRISTFHQRLSLSLIDEHDLENISPAEKYDLYLGDTSFTYSSAIWQSLFEHEQNAKDHHIKNWEGICHGWSSAAAFMNRPTKKILVQSIDGRFAIPFYPDDLKALSSALWANSLIQDQSIIEGLRCNTDHPRLDSNSGKVLTTQCKGVNPGVWHLVVLGLIGEKRMPFIINVNNDDEVWNQPATGFEFNYYQPQTGVIGLLEQVAVPVHSIQDRFAGFRDPNTAYIVGVDMNFKYMNETSPSHNPVDDPTKDSSGTLHMRYELELDAGYQVLGGEWVNTEDQDRENIPNYPAFIWRFQSDEPIAASIADSKVPDVNDPMFHNPTFMHSLNQEASNFRYQYYLLDENGIPTPSTQEFRPQPLGKIIYQLIEMSQ